MTLKFIGAVAIKEEIKTLLHLFNDEEIDVRFDLNPIVAARLINGELFDIAITNPWHVKELAEKGCPLTFPVWPGSVSNRNTDLLAAVKSRAGVEKPDTVFTPMLWAWLNEDRWQDVETKAELSPTDLEAFRLRTEKAARDRE